MDALLNIFRSIFFVLMLCSRADAQDLPVIRTGSPFDPGEGQITSLTDSDSAGYYYLMGDADEEIDLPAGQQSAILVFDKSLEFTKKIPVQCASDEKLTDLKPISFIKTDSGFILLCSRYSAIERNLKSFLFLITIGKLFCSFATRRDCFMMSRFFMPTKFSCLGSMHLIK